MRFSMSSSRSGQLRHVKIVHAGGLAAGDPRIGVRSRLGLLVVRHPGQDLRQQAQGGKAERLGKNLQSWPAAGCTICGMMNRTYKIGHSRDQASFLPPCLEDYVSRDNPVRAIDAYVDALDLNELGFRDLGSDGGAGQPPYDPADLLRLYLYGYLHQVRSSRRLERETRRNVELMWLLGGLTPGYRTIANFRKDNAAGLKAANRDFVLLARRLDLLGGTLVAIDGAFFHGDASKASIVTEKRLQQQMAALDRSIAEYNAALEANSLPSRRRGTRRRRRLRQ